MTALQNTNVRDTVKGIIIGGIVAIGGFWYNSLNTKMDMVITTQNTLSNHIESDKTIHENTRQDMQAQDVKIDNLSYIVNTHINSYTK